jgi:cell division protein FtsW (lipid II flippase)
MSVTDTTAAERDARRLQSVAWRGLVDPLLAATSCVAILAIALAAAGRLRAFDESERGRSATLVNLNAVQDAASLAPAMGPVFATERERADAAQELFRYISAARAEGGALPNVGAISRATTGGSSSSPLFTPAIIAKLKPSLSVRTREEFRGQALLFGALYVLGFHAVALLWRHRRVRHDRVLLAAVHLLTAIGFAVLLSRPDPLRDSLLFVRYSETILAGLAVMAALALVDFGAAGFVSLIYLPLIAALSLSVLLILFGSGPGRSAAKVNLGPFQPIEGIRLLLALFLAGYFARKWELLRGVRGRTIRDVRLPAWINLPRADYVLPVLVGVAAALSFFFFQKDLGPALFLCCVFLAVYAIARGRAGMAAIGLALLVAGFYVGYRLQVSTTLADRVRMWQSPWDNAVAGGNQTTHAIWAMATGGAFGSGLGLGDARYLPAGHTDLVLAAIGEELGAAGLIAVAALFGLLAWRGLRIGRLASNDYGFFLAASLTLFLILPALIMAAGVMGVTPLTGVVTPFLSYGGSAMLANFAALGLLMAIHGDRRAPGDFSPFRVPVLCLAAVLGLAAAVLVGVAVNVQVVKADEYAVKPHLGVHADGGRRYEYNPRVTDVVRQIPRGTIYDRRGLPLATEDPAVLAAAREAYARMGVSLAEACPRPDERCYPLGGLAFHALGDAKTRANWSATNTSYVERDADSRLRGFDDHASTVKTADAAGRPMYTVLRDYREILPVLRHRYESGHPAVAALRDRPRDVRLTLDADLQRRVASIVAGYARKADGRAAAVVLDPDTGAVLASVSYPWPSTAATGQVEIDKDAPDPWLDRARYGAYPPGSTFKLVVAMAALRERVTGARYTCARLPDGRVGTRIDGWSRPVRDDVLDTRPHGSIDMHEGIVHSCNAYFAQLAVHLGPDPLLAIGNRLRIPLTAADGSSAQRVRDALPQVGFGQAQVVASPMRMATVAAAVASNGLLHPPFLDDGARGDARAEPLVDPKAARVLGGYMRDVVLSGTARALRDGRLPIAGKTGTAEVSGRQSHGWFVGYAPYGSARKKIAFAIIVEQAGYGGRSAALAAGEIVAAAEAAGLIGK